MAGRHPPGLIKPRQQRSRKTLDRLLDATEALLQERRFEEIQVADIVARAGSSVGSFYARFPAKESLVTALLDRYHHDTAAQLSEAANDMAWQGQDLAGRVRLLISRVVQTCQQRRGLLRLRLQRMLNPADPAAASEPGWGLQLVAELMTLLNPCRHEIRHSDPDRALAFALRLIDGAVANAIAFDEVGASYGKLDEQELINELTTAVTAYLTRPPGT